jgi:hypothetical protein
MPTKKTHALHVTPKAHAVIRGVSARTGLKMSVLAERIITAWAVGEYFHVPPALHVATPHTRKG